LLTVVLLVVEWVVLAKYLHASQQVATDAISSPQKPSSDGVLWERSHAPDELNPFTKARRYLLLGK
jgi:hypothetical protein